MRRTSSLVFLVCALGCASAEVPRDSAATAPGEQGDDAAPSVGASAPGADPWSSGDDAAAVGALVEAGLEMGDDTAAPTNPDDAQPATDASLLPPSPVPPFDPGEGGVCAAVPGVGDLVITELMIESVAGAGDHGEWLEVANTRECAFDLRGLHGNAPTGAKVRTFDIGDDVWIPAFGTFVVADSSNPPTNHALPGLVIVWSGQPGDVLRNKGGTITLQYGGTIVDSVTYPSMTLVVGASLSFPQDCPLSRRGDWAAWQPSTASWFPAFYGTPNAPNDDVQCP